MPEWARHWQQLQFDHGWLLPYSPDLFAASWFARYLATYACTIAGGTSEIQRNIIAQRAVGLPRR